MDFFALRAFIDNDFKNLRYLVIEDQPHARQTLRLCIQAMGGFSVDMTQSYGEAVGRLKTRMPDVILCDYILSDTRTGQQLLEELRRSGRLPDEVVFIMVTAERGYEQVISAVELIPDDYIIKPFSPELLRLRLEKVIRKKQAFATYYTSRAAKEWDKALAELDNIASQPQTAIYRYEAMRYRAEVLLEAERYDHAGAAYQAILDEHPFPWAKAGYARVLRHENQLPRARNLLDEVIAQVPRYFGAYDLKADICSDMGDHAAALSTLETACALNPANWDRKREMAMTASRSGDDERAAEIMQELVEKAEQIGLDLPTLLDMARCAIGVRNSELALTLLERITPEQLEEVVEDFRISYDCLLITSRGDPAEIDRIRPALIKRTRYFLDTAVDAVRMALVFDDLALAIDVASKLLGSAAARRAFKSLLTVFAQYGREQEFRDLQMDVASQRLIRRA